MSYVFKGVEIVFEKSCHNCFLNAEWQNDFCNNPSGKACENYLNFLAFSEKILSKGLEKGNHFVFKLGDFNISVMRYEDAFERAKNIMKNAEKIHNSVKKENGQNFRIVLNDDA